MAEDRVLGERVEVINIDPELGEVNGQELIDKAVDWLNVLQHIGGTVQIGVRREELEDEPGVFITTAAVFKWNSYLPGRRPPHVEAVPENGTEPEPAVVE